MLVKVRRPELFFFSFIVFSLAKFVVTLYGSDYIVVLPDQHIMKVVIVMIRSVRFVWRVVLLVATC